MIDRRMRSNVRRINRGLRRKQRAHGQQVEWYAYDATVADDDGLDTDVYDEGPSYTRTWATGRLIPVMQAYYNEAPQGDTTDGLYLVDSIRLTIVADSFQSYLGLALLDTRHHLHDRFAYEGRVYSVSSFDLMGRVADDYLIVSVVGTQVMVEEGVRDASGEPGV